VEADPEFLAETGKKKSPCSIGILISQLDENDRKRVKDALEDDRVSARAIAIVLGRWYGNASGKGIDVQPQRVYRHRTGVCSCGR